MTQSMADRELEIAALMEDDFGEALTYNGTTAFTGIFNFGSTTPRVDVPVGEEQVQAASLLVRSASIPTAIGTFVTGSIVKRDADATEWCVIRVQSSQYGMVQMTLQAMERVTLGRM